MWNSVADRDPKAAQRMVCAFDYESTEEQWALAYRWDIVLRGRGATPVEHEIG
jgi:protocatechuate 3,4-dioxygenase beta subunit